jgi:HAD superfamily hydrolase (TIGR01509 family)
VTQAVVFDLDGVLLQSEEVWDAVRERYVRERGGRYDDEVQRAMMGMSAPEWSRYLHEKAGVPEDPETINGDVVARMLEAYRNDLPLLPGAADAVRRAAAAFPLALASSSNREVFEAVLELAGLAECFRATVSSEEVERGKPAPDVYLEAARRLGVEPETCAAVEDSHAGIRSAKSAGMRVVAIPNASYPPDDEALGLADAVVGSLDELTVDVLRGD